MQLYIGPGLGTTTIVIVVIVLAIVVFSFGVIAWTSIKKAFRKIKGLFSKK